jgi:hypothetical protein
MNKTLTELERLDLVARGEAAKTTLRRIRVPFVFASGFCVLLAIISSASLNETVAVRLLAVLMVLATIMVWLSARYSAYVLAACYAAFLIGGWLFDAPDYHTFLGSTTRAVLTAMFLLWGYYWWTNARPFMSAQSEGFEKERSRVQEWIWVLKSPEETYRVVEVSRKSFWRGYWTYRLLNTGSCWVIGKFKIGNLRRLLDCRVRALDAVHFIDQAEGKLNIEMGDRSIQKVDISPVMRDRLLHSQ